MNRRCTGSGVITFLGISLCGLWSIPQQLSLACGIYMYMYYSQAMVEQLGIQGIDRVNHM